MVDLFKDPESFDEAYNHPEADKKIMWRRAILKEFEEFGRNFRSRRFPTDETVSKINGFLKPNVTEYFERG
jgi:hypothetical protein